MADFAPRMAAVWERWELFLACLVLKMPWPGGRPGGTGEKFPALLTTHFSLSLSDFRVLSRILPLSSLLVLRREAWTLGTPGPAGGDD